MKKIWAITSIIIITAVFIYSMIYLSADNICSWVRIYDCQKKENKSLVSNSKYIELKVTWDVFLKNCKPKIKEEENIYLLDYSECNLKVIIWKEKMWVDDVEVNWKKLSREDIDNNF
jgi:uncharacterized protein YxeA